jgi:hypothetical protein
MHKLADRHLLALITLGALLLLAHTAHARHTEEQRLNLDNAYTLQEGKLRVGIWKVQWGALDSLTVGSHIWPWLLRVPNAHARWKIWEEGDLAFGVEAGVFSLNLRSFGEDNPDVRFLVVPAEGYGSWRLHPDWTLSAGFVSALVRTDGTIEAGGGDGELVAAVSNFQLSGSVEWRLSDVTALVLNARYVVAQQTGGAASSSFRVDPYTTVEVVGTGDTDALDVGGGGSVSAGAVWSWDNFNLRLGLTTGNYTIPGVNFVLPSRVTLPEFDMFLLF